MLCNFLPRLTRKTRRKHGIPGDAHMEGVRKIYSAFVESQKLKISPTHTLPRLANFSFPYVYRPSQKR